MASAGLRGLAVPFMSPCGAASGRIAECGHDALERRTGDEARRNRGFVSLMASTTKFAVTGVGEERSVTDEVPEPPGKDPWGTLPAVSPGVRPARSKMPDTGS